MNVSEENKTIAKYAEKALGGIPDVRIYHHDTVKLSVPLLICVDAPWDGITSYSTIGLSDYPMFKRDGTEFPARLEIVGACATASEFFPNIISSAAFNIMRNRRLYYPGAAMPGYVGEYYPTTTVPHLYFHAPFLWEDSLKTLTFATKKVSWLLVVPISDAELKFLGERGDDALEDEFEKHQIDIFNLNRESAV